MFIKKAKTFLLACLLAFALCALFTAKTFGQEQEVRYVDKTAEPISDGLTWETAYISLTQALSVANSNPGDWEIRVAQGTYHPKNEFASFRILNKPGQEAGDRIVLLGGFAGLQGANPDLRDPKVFTTILTGDTLGDDVDFGNCLSNQDGWKDQNRLNNSDTVVIVLNCGLGNRIDGFIIEGGNQGQVPFESKFAHGGGMYIADSSIDVVNCTFRFNVSGLPENVPVHNGLIGEGGGAYVSGGKLANGDVGFTRFINCTFHDNVSSRGGALAILNRSSEVTKVKVINSLFYDNQAIEMSTAVIKPGDDNDRLVQLPMKRQTP
ncbi:MAG: hypothetical protein IID30_08005 [Planctomycetes bacterium]|nr:hypothetical protein [Planctomycetota bacterium]